MHCIALHETLLSGEGEPGWERRGGGGDALSSTVWTPLVKVVTTSQDDITQSYPEPPLGKAKKSSSKRATIIWKGNLTSQYTQTQLQHTKQYCQPLKQFLTGTFEGIL